MVTILVWHKEEKKRKKKKKNEKIGYEMYPEISRNMEIELYQIMYRIPIFKNRLRGNKNYRSILPFGR